MSYISPNEPWTFEFQSRIKVAYCGRFPSRPDWKLSKRRIPKNRTGFFFAEKNDCTITINERRVLLKEGSLLITQGGEEFSAEHSPQKPLTVLSVAITLEQGKIPNLLFQRSFERHYKIKDPAEYSSQFDTLLSSFSHSPATRDWAMTGALLHWLAYVLEITQAPLNSNRLANETSIDKILSSQSWAKSRLNSNITLMEWSKITGWHPVYFERAFKREVGISPMSWLNTQRMEAARQDLVTTNRSIVEISETLGYSDPFYFSRVFKRHFGKSPAQYRKQTAQFS